MKRLTRISLLFSGVAMLFSGCVTKDYHMRKVAYYQDRIKELKKKNAKKHLAQKARYEELQERFTQQLALAKKYKDRCRASLLRMADKKSKKAQELRRALRHIATLQKKTKEWRNLYDRLVKIFKVRIAAGTLAVKMEHGMIILRMPEKVLFELESAKLKGAGIATIQDITRTLRNYKYRWQVTGHADPTGTAKFNWNLSFRRAMSVLRVMLHEDMPPEQLSAAAFGQYQPAASNESPEGRALNRRTEIVFVPNLEKLLQMPKLKLARICTPPKTQPKAS